MFWSFRPIISSGNGSWFFIFQNPIFVMNIHISWHCIVGHIIHQIRKYQVNNNNCICCPLTSQLVLFWILMNKQCKLVYFSYYSLDNDTNIFTVFTMNIAQGTLHMYVCAISAHWSMSRSWTVYIVRARHRLVSPAGV